jgi:DNA-directed RNA polymerase specialized sigma24 family protein
VGEAGSVRHHKVTPRHIECIEYLYVRGLSRRRIGEVLGLHHNTVAQYTELAEEARERYQAQLIERVKEEL